MKMEIRKHKMFGKEILNMHCYMWGTEKIFYYLSVSMMVDNDNFSVLTITEDSRNYHYKKTMHGNMFELFNKMNEIIQDLELDIEV